MKLEKLIEDKSSIYLADAEEIHSYISKYFTIESKQSGTTRFVTKENYIINKDFSVSFITSDYVIVDLEQKPMKIKIRKVNTLDFMRGCHLDSLSFLPNMCNTLSFNGVTLPKNSVIKTNVKNKLALHYINNVENIDIKATCGIKKISFFKCNIRDINVSFLKDIDQCDIQSINHMDFTHLRFSSIGYCSIICNDGEVDKLMKKFTGIENFSKVINFHINCAAIESYSGIENINAEILSLNSMKHHNNIINVLLIKTNNILMNGKSIDRKVLSIIKKYNDLALSTRKDHVMDCAVELIDAGFEEAAEL